MTGTANIFSATVTETGHDSIGLDIGGASFRTAPPSFPVVPGTAVDVAIRSDRVNLRRPGEIANAFQALLAEEFAFGSSHSLHFQPEGAGPRVEVEIASRPYEVLGVATNPSWLIELPADDLHVMPSG